MTAVEATPRRPRKETASPVKVRVSGIVIVCVPSFGESVADKKKKKDDEAGRQSV